MKRGADRSPTTLRAQARAAFLGALAEGISVTAAAERAKVHRSTVYEWREADSDFAQAWEDAYEQGSDLLESEAWRRGHDGVDKPVYQGGQLVGMVREYSDALMLALLKARRPQRYRERMSVDQHVEHSTKPLSGDELKRLRSLNQDPAFAAAADAAARALGDLERIEQGAASRLGL